MKGCIYHFTKWQIHPFIAKGISNVISADYSVALLHFISLKACVLYQDLEKEAMIYCRLFRFLHLLIGCTCSIACLSRREQINQCWFGVGPASQTLDYR